HSQRARLGTTLSKRHAGGPPRGRYEQEEAKIMILVAGATGLVGGQVCVGLTKTGQSVRALVRSTSDPAKVEMLRSKGVALARGDLKDRSSLDAACSGVTTVVSTASS